MIELDKVQQRLAQYLGARVAKLQVLASGWETTVFELVLASRATSAQLPVGCPLVLRFYHGSKADEKAPREYRAVRQLSAAGYPAPRPYLFVADHTPLEAPFLIMDRFEGGPLFAPRSFLSAFKTFSLAFFSFVRAHATLHRMDPRRAAPEGLDGAYAGSAAMSLLDRVLATIAERVEAGPLPALKPALEWANVHAARFRLSRESVVHMDYHPQNVVVKGLRVTGVIDWVNADFGDRHLDAGMTAAILWSSAMERPRWIRENLVGNTLRRTFASLYVALYHAIAPLDLERFRYCQAVAAMLRLSTLGMMRARGPETVGYRPESISEVTPSVVRLLSRFAARKSGIPLRSDLALPELAATG